VQAHVVALADLGDVVDKLAHRRLAQGQRQPLGKLVLGAALTGLQALDLAAQVGDFLGITARPQQKGEPEKPAQAPPELPRFPGWHPAKKSLPRRPPHWGAFPLLILVMVSTLGTILPFTLSLRQSRKS